MGYVPERGDVIWLEFNPQAGHEQAGHRPALVVSPAAYNGKTSLALVCPTAVPSTACKLVFATLSNLRLGSPSFG